MPARSAWMCHKGLRGALHASMKGRIVKDGQATRKPFSKTRLVAFVIVVCSAAWATLFVVTILNTPRQLPLESWNGWGSNDYDFYLHATPDGYVLNDMAPIPTPDGRRVKLTVQTHYYTWLTDNAYLTHRKATLSGIPEEPDLDKQWVQDQVFDLMLKGGTFDEPWESLNNPELESWEYDEKELELIEKAIIRKAALTATRQVVLYPMLILVFPILLLVFAMRTTRRERWLRAGRCSECGYDLVGLGDYKCPECGTQHDQQLVDTYSARRHRRNANARRRGRDGT
jgi:hypothetical protein